MKKSPLDLPVPDYAGGSLLNLMASIIRGLGGRTPHPDLRALPHDAVAGRRHVILLLIDGLGAEQLDHYLSSPARRRASPFFAAHPPRAILDTVSPATTAAVVTTVATGASPAEHGITGWHIHFPDLGAAATLLPYRSRTGAPFALPDFPLADYLRLPAPLATIPVAKHLVSTVGIPTSATSLAQPWWTTRRAYSALPGLHRHLLAIAREKRPSYTYAYWPHYDSVCHASGPFSRPAVSHLKEIDAALARLAAAFAKLKTLPLLLVTADHGLMPVERLVDLSKIPGLYDTFTTLPSGDARCMHLFVRPSRTDAALAILRAPALADAHRLLTRDEYLSSGLLGPGRPHPALASRTGDYVLLAAPGIVFQGPSPYSHVFRFRGHHSGLTPTETRTPLIVL